MHGNHANNKLAFFRWFLVGCREDKQNMWNPILYYFFPHSQPPLKINSIFIIIFIISMEVEEQTEKKKKKRLQTFLHNRATCLEIGPYSKHHTIIMLYI